MPELLAHNNRAVFFFPALLLSLALVPLTIRLSERIGAIDRPDGRKVHARAVSRLGGLAMVAGIVVPLVAFQRIDGIVLAFLAGLFVVTVTGLLDDVYKISPSWKFAGEIAAAALFVFGSGVSIEELGNLLGIGEIRLGAVAPAVTIFCMVGVMNALNLCDGLDGLAGGLGVIGCSFLAAFAYFVKEWLPLNILSALLGALIGFLRYNSYPARLFMGDSGSLPLGYALSAVAVLLVRNGTPGHVAPVTVAAVLALPVIDTLMVMGSRVRRGENPFRPDRKHLHHRLLNLGLPHAAAVPILYVSASSFGLVAWFLHASPEWAQFGAVLFLAGVIYGFVGLAERLGVRVVLPGRGHGAEKDDGMHHLLAPLLGKSVRVVGWLIPLGLFVPTIALGDVPRPVAWGAFGAAAFVAALFPWKADASRSAVRNGLMYAACACLLCILQMVPDAPRWVPGYLAALSGAVLVWVLLKMRYRGHRELLPVSSFEILLIGMTIFVSLVLAPVLKLDEGARRLLLTVCLESVAFLLATKIIVRQRPGRRYLVAAGFLVALLLIGMKGLLVTRPATASPQAGTATSFRLPSFRLPANLP